MSCFRPNDQKAMRANEASVGSFQTLTGKSGCFRVSHFFRIGRRGAARLIEISHSGDCPPSFNELKSSWDQVVDCRGSQMEICAPEMIIDVSIKFGLWLGHFPRQDRGHTDATCL